MSVMDMSNFSITKVNSTIYTVIQKTSQISQDFYPEQMAKLLILNAPWSFTACWSVIKGYLGEATIKKIDVLGSKQSYKELSNLMNDDQIPTWLGGQNDKCLSTDPGPWHDYEIVDGHKRGDIVGIRKKSDGPNGKVFTPCDMEALPNLLLEDP